MKTLCAYLLLGLLTSSLTSFNERSTPPVKQGVLTRYCIHWSLYRGTWANSKTTSAKVLFITDIVPFDCVYSSDCDDIKRRLKRDFMGQLSSYEVLNPSVVPEYFDTRSKAELARNKQINDWKQNYGYQIVEL
ncbi:hypothetical protein GCM10028805_36580 [Spirosoma harenae]